MAHEYLNLFSVSVDCLVGFRLEGVDETCDANDDVWNTEQLSHIEYHVVLEGFLVLLKTLDQDSEAENTDHEDAEERTMSDNQVLSPIEEPQQTEDAEVE